jgi:hypothetical protein
MIQGALQTVIFETLAVVIHERMRTTEAAVLNTGCGGC